MIRARPVLLAVALALAAVACTSAKTSPAGVRLSQPSAVAVFKGKTLQDPVAIRPYIAIANAARNDVSILDAVTDQPVASPVKFRTLVLAVEDRPSLLAAASLGDDKSDLLVAVAGGDSVLQVVETWSSANTVHSDPAEAPAALAVDLGFDVLALAPMPPDPANPGTARLAVALAGAAPPGGLPTVPGHVAIVEWRRALDEITGLPGEAIELAGPPVVRDVPFEPLAIAVMPDDPDVPGLQTALYLATLDRVAGVFGVAEISADLSNASNPRGLGARSPTRLVAAARLRERRPDSAASDGSAFDVARVPRVYAVLDESGCGLTNPIDCGIVTLDPTAASGTQAIPPDGTGIMPYRAPMRISGRPLALAVSGPPAVQADHVDGEPAFTEGLMRLYMGKVARATTGVGAVASENGAVYFLDLGRFETANVIPIVVTRGAGSPLADYLSDKRLWIQNPADGSFAETAAAAMPLITVTPGFTGDEAFSVTYQGIVSPGDLYARAGEAGEYAPGQPWLALQLGDGPGGGPRLLNEVVRLWHPALGVKPGDVLVISALGMPATCVGTAPPGTSSTTPESQIVKEFELRIADLLPPAPDYPGGAVSLVPPSASDPVEWSTCYQALVDAAAGTNVWTGLTVTVRAAGLVLTGTALGYAGRPQIGAPFALGYPTDPARNEDALAIACPVADWAGGLPAPPCDAACRDACEALVLARKSRRLQSVSVDCATDPARADACATLWPGNTFPAVSGATVLGFQIGVQPRNAATADPVRDLRLRVTTSSGVLDVQARGSSTSPYGANGATAFDRSPWEPAAGYRFLMSYPADFVLDTTPSQTPVPSVVIR